MASPIATQSLPGHQNIPILYEDEGIEDMGENNLHTWTDIILLVGIETHLERYQPGLRVFANLNLHYLLDPLSPSSGSRPFVTPDIMIVRPFRPLPLDLPSYTIEDEGPVPMTTLEILSERTAEDRDLTTKPVIFAKLGISEYLLVDPTGNFLPQRLLKKRLLPNGTWKDEQDADGGVTSQLGFRIVLEESLVRVINATTGEKYLRPREGQNEALARHQAEERAQKVEQRLGELEAELARLKEKPISG